MNKTLTFYKIICAFGLFHGQSLKAIDVAENCNKEDIAGAIRVLETAARNLKISDDEKLREIGQKIDEELLNIVIS